MEFKDEKHFNYDQERIIFIGDILRVFIPSRYRNINVFSIDGDTVTTLGVFEVAFYDEQPDKTMIVTEGGWFFSAMIEMIPSEVRESIRDGDKVIELVFKKDDTFINSKTYLINASLAGLMFTEFVQQGHMPKFLSYDQIGDLFNLFKKQTGVGFPINSAVIEILMAHLSRKQDNPNIQYRLAKDAKGQRGPLKFIPLKTISYGTDSVTAKISGSYFDDGLYSAFVSENDNPSDLETLMIS
jgi:hypothetical protein